MAHSAGDRRESRKNLAQKHRKDAEAGCRKALDEALELGLEETFPGSDAVSATQPVGSGRKDRT
jgi:hypothetical protein